MKTWEKIMLYPIGLYIWLTDGIMKMSKKWKPAMAMLMVVVMLCGMLPATVFAVETPTITVTGLTAPQAGQSAEEWLDGISPVLSPDYEWADAVWYEGAFDNYGEMMSYTDGDEFVWNFAPGQSYTLDLAVLSETPTLPRNATVNVPGATSAVYVYWGEGFEGWYYADILIVYTVGYEVSFDANGGTGTMIPAEVKEGEEYTLPECGFTAPSNKTFKAWSVGGEEKQPGDKITVSADTTVTAVWQATITVTGLTAPQAGQSVEEWLDGVSPVLSPDYEWANAVWYEGAFDNYGEMISYNEWGEFWWNFGSGQSYTLYLSLISDNPTTLPLNATVNVPGATSAVYEYWGEGYSDDWYFACILIVYTVGYEVSFDANGGTGTMIPAEVKEGEEYTLPECGFTAPSNKAFKAWSVGGEEKQPGDKITVSADTTVTAVWQNLVKYELWVGGVQVTNANAGNITGEGITGAVSYDSTTKTLTLNNATITGVHEFSIFDDVSGIYGKETLKINLIGNNTITGSDIGGSSYGIFIDDGNLTFTGPGSLTVSAADLSEHNWSVAVYAEGTITVEESCTITAYCGANAWIACAFKSYAGSNEYNLPNATGILVAGNKNAPEATNFEVCNGDPDEFQYLRIAPGYTVTLNKDGGTIHSGNVTCYFVDTGATLPTEVTKANSIFGGWYDNAECTGTAITEIPVGSTGEKEYWAKWTTVHTCSIEPVDKVWPDCENGGKEAYYKCEGCGKFFEDANGTTEIVDIATWGNLPKNGHTEGTAWEKDTTHHWHICTVAGCGAAVDSSAHTPDRAAATETDPVKCSVCGYEIAPALGHTHAYGAAWKSDADNHWNECVCGEKANAAAHKDENGDGKCDVCEYEVGTPGGSDDDDQPAGNPQTGDNSVIHLWIMLLCMSAMGIVALTVFSKKKSVR